MDQGILGNVLNCLVFNAGGRLQQLAEVVRPALEDVGPFYVRTVPSDARIGVTVLVAGL